MTIGAMGLEGQSQRLPVVELWLAEGRFFYRCQAVLDQPMHIWAGQHRTLFGSDGVAILVGQFGPNMGDFWMDEGHTLTLTVDLAIDEVKHADLRL